MSLGGPFPSRFLERAIDRAIENGLIVCGAAGNYWPWVVYPARYEQVVAVAAVNCKKKPWSGSARGSSVDISAPGESVWRAKTLADTNDPYLIEPSSGTSFSVATVAGAAALWLAFHGRKRLLKKYGANRLASVFREILATHGFERPQGWDYDKYGVGILRADRLLEAKLPTTPRAAGLAPMALRAPRRPPSHLERIADYFPEADRQGLGSALEQLLRTRPEDLDDLLERNGDELIFHLATNAKLRSSVHQASRRQPTATARRRLSTNRALLKNASRTLRRQMGLVR
jgi:thermitase